MSLEFRMFAWRVQDRMRRLVLGTGSAIGIAVRIAIVATLAVASLQAMYAVAAWWDDGMLELELRSLLGPHQTEEQLEGYLKTRARQELGPDVYVTARVEFLCPAPGEIGPLEKIASTCLIRGRVEYERDVLFVRRRTTLEPSVKAFRDAIPVR